MTSSRNTFNDVVEFVKKVKGVRQDGYAKIVGKKSQKIGNF